MPQHITAMHSRAGLLPQAPGKPACKCADADINTQTVGPLASLSPFSSYKVQGVLFLAKGEGWGGHVCAEAGNHLVQIKIAHSGPQHILRAS